MMGPFLRFFVASVVALGAMAPLVVSGVSSKRRVRDSEGGVSSVKGSFLRFLTKKKNVETSTAKSFSFKRKTTGGEHSKTSGREQRKTTDEKAQAPAAIPPGGVPFPCGVLNLDKSTFYWEPDQPSATSLSGVRSGKLKTEHGGTIAGYSRELLNFNPDTVYLNTFGGLRIGYITSGDTKNEGGIVTPNTLSDGGTKVTDYYSVYDCRGETIQARVLFGNTSSKGYMYEVYNPDYTKLLMKFENVYKPGASHKQGVAPQGKFVTPDGKTMATVGNPAVIPIAKETPTAEEQKIIDLSAKLSKEQKTNLIWQIQFADSSSLGGASVETKKLLEPLRRWLICLITIQRPLLHLSSSAEVAVSIQHTGFIVAFYIQIALAISLCLCGLLQIYRSVYPMRNDENMWIKYNSAGFASNF